MYRGQIKDFVGDIGFAEKYLGPGGTHTFIIIFAFLCFFLSLMYYLGTLQSLLQSTLGRFFR
jgi:amino acid permease